jgi:uncharacterized protein with GYD domain
MVEGKLSEAGVAGLMLEGGSRRHAAVRQAVASLGGTLEAYYFTFGTNDVLGIVELPDNSTAAALSLAFSAGGAVSAVATTPLLAPEEIDAAVAMHPDYTPPGSRDT